MVCTASDLHGWKDFPKGLRVLLLDGDSSSAAEIKAKLEEMEYVGETLHSLPHPCSSQKRKKKSPFVNLALSQDMFEMLSKFDCLFSNSPNQMNLVNF